MISLYEQFMNKVYNNKDLDNPDFDNAEWIHDWRNYVGEHVQSIWDTLDLETRAAIALDADVRAGNEDWD